MFWSQMQIKPLYQKHIKTTSISQDIGFINGDIHDRSCKN